MKYTIHVLLTALMFCTYTSLDKTTDPLNDIKPNELNKSGYTFKVNVSRINSKYSEIASTTFRNKLVIVSSKKIGALGNGINPNTNEPYTDLFCTDIMAYGKFSQPLLFSRIINTKASEGQVAFSPDEHTIYYTRNERGNSSNFKLFKANLVKNSYGKWINEVELDINGDSHSIENPHMSADGKFLYFSSNMKDGYGGFDLYKAEVYKNGNLGKPINLGSTVNSSKDEKYPHTTTDGKELYFSSKGHNSLGGYDIFISNIRKTSFTSPRNLGLDINSNKDEIAYIIIKGDQGVFSSNKDNENNGYNMYHVKSTAIYKELKGIIISEEEKILANTTIILLDGDGEEIERQTTSKDASYSFIIKAYNDYKIVVKKEGYNDYALDFQSETNPLKAILKLSPDGTLTKKKK